jgi:hypothetical protein
MSSSLGYIVTTALQNHGSWVWWYVSVIPALQRHRLEDHEFKASLGFEWSPGQLRQCNNTLSQPLPSPKNGKQTNMVLKA